MKKIDILFFLLLMAGVVGIYHFFIGQGRSIKAQNPYKHELYKEQVLRRKAMAAQNKKKRSSSKSKKGAKHKKSTNSRDMLGQILKKHDSSKSSSKYDTKDANALMKDLKNIINKKGSVSTQEFMQNLQNSTIGSMDQIEKDVEKFEKEMGLH